MCEGGWEGALGRQGDLVKFQAPLFSPIAFFSVLSILDGKNITNHCPNISGLSSHSSFKHFPSPCFSMCVCTCVMCDLCQLRLSLSHVQGILFVYPWKNKVHISKLTLITHRWESSHITCWFNPPVFCLQLMLDHAPATTYHIPLD